MVKAAYCTCATLSKNWYIQSDHSDSDINFNSYDVIYSYPAAKRDPEPRASVGYAIHAD